MEKYIIKNYIEKTTRTGKPYLDLMLGNKEGITEAKMWNTDEETLLKKAGIGNVVEAEIKKERYAGEDKFVCTDLRLCPSQDKADLLNMSADRAVLEETYDNITDEASCLPSSLRDLVMTIYTKWTEYIIISPLDEVRNAAGDYIRTVSGVLGMLDSLCGYCGTSMTEDEVAFRKAAAMLYRIGVVEFYEFDKFGEAVSKNHAEENLRFFSYFIVRKTGESLGTNSEILEKLLSVIMEEDKNRKVSGLLNNLYTMGQFFIAEK